MNRKARRALASEQRQHVQQFPEQLTEVPFSEWPFIPHDAQPNLTRVWRSRVYMVQEYIEANAFYPHLIRLSICRAEWNGKTGRWKDGLTWDELQAIKAEVGYGDWWGVEIYPRTDNVVNVANIRHLWLLPAPLPIGWMGNGVQSAVP